MYKKLPRTKETDNLMSFIPFEILNAYSLTKCFPLLSKKLFYLPGFDPISFIQDYTVQEHYGFGIMFFKFFYKNFNDKLSNYKMKLNNLDKMPDYYTLKEEYNKMYYLNPSEFFFNKFIEYEKGKNLNKYFKEKDIDFIIRILNINSNNKNGLQKDLTILDLEKIKQCIHNFDFENLLEFDDNGYITEISKELIELNIAY